MNHTTLNRRHFLGATAMLAVLGPMAARAATDAPAMHVVKTPTCGCCGAWVDLARQTGFEVTVTDTDDYDGMKSAQAVPEALWSCHTATVAGYVIEGHVPFAAIRKLLSDRPRITGLAVPGMPGDSPGMAGGADAVVPVVAWGGDAGDAAPFSF
ncbi:DUF411 domain-containing protein [Paracoccus marinaquae]|uniref:CopG family transcriptional regulator n=1 Tax=Paracoccus marinaquae TaxID=2841926 RepID=A0ABS6AJQ5_9RHOB|nr:DUF411 domain-containing protein [Paracoccus marinaquae]MBU3030826.1 CopG family transcriptional regulator [Paracoccus marinaquae]